MKSEMESMNKRLIESEAREKEIAEECHAMKAECDRLQSQYEASQSHVAEATKAKDEIEAKVASLSSELASAGIEYKLKCDEVTDLTELLEANSDKSDSSVMKIRETLSKEIDSLRHELRDYEKLRIECNAKSAKLEKLQSEITLIKADSEKTRSEMESTISATV